MVPIALAAAVAGAAVVVAAPLHEREATPRRTLERRSFDEPGPVLPEARERAAVSRAAGQVLPETGALARRSTLSVAACVLAASPDGRFVASGDGDGILRIWDARAVRQIHLHEAHVVCIRCLAWSADSTLLASAGGRKIRIWNVATGAEPVVIVAEYPRAIAFGPDGSLLDSNGGEWDPTFGRSLLQPPDEVEISADHCEPDLDTPFEGPSNGAAIGIGGTFPESESVPLRRLGRQPSWCDGAVWAPNGATVLTVRDGAIALRNATTGCRITTLAERGRLVAFSADSRWICSGPYDYVGCTLRIWNGWSGALRDTIELPAPPMCLTATCADIWVGCTDGTIRRVPLPR